MKSTLLCKSHFLRACLALLHLSCAAISTQAQVSSALPSYPLRGLTAYDSAKKPLGLDTLKGHTVLAVLWSTKCSMCRELLPEFRSNVAGWRNKPFKLVLINIDKEYDEWLGYEKVVQLTQKQDTGIHSVHSVLAQVPTTLASPNELQNLNRPMAVLYDGSGKILEKHTGRMPGAAWSKIGQML